MSESVLVSLAVIVVFGGAAQWLAWRLGLPSILLLLVAGFVAGPATGLVDPDGLLGDLLLPVVSLSVALILYEGGLTLKLSELGQIGAVLRNLVTVGLAVTWVVSALAARLLFDMDWSLCVLLGAILTVTGPTVIVPLLRHIRPTGPVGAVLKWEGIVIDPIGALLAVLVFEALAMGGAREATAQVVLAVLKTAVVGGGLGLLAAAMLTMLLRRYWVPDFLQNAISLMFVVAVFTASNAVQHEAGLFAVTVMGIALANQKAADVRHIVEFKENLRLLLISALFIVLAARLEVADLARVAGTGAAFVAVLVVVCRPLTVLVSTLRSRLKGRERVFLACMAPRGIVAAAVSSVFALRLEEIGVAQARLLVPVTFLVIVGTVLVYGLFSPTAARLLGVAVPNPQGVLLLGAQPWVRSLAETLQGKGFRVLLVDSNRDHTAAARMAGLPTYTGSILADYALDEMDLGGIGRLLALTPNEWVNALAVQRFASILGRSECYQLPPETAGEKRSPHQHLHGRWLFGERLNHSVLEECYFRGARFKATRLTESFTYADFRRLYGEEAVPVFRIRKEGRLSVMTATNPPNPEPGDTLVALVREPAEQTGPA